MRAARFNFHLLFPLFRIFARDIISTADRSRVVNTGTIEASKMTNFQFYFLKITKSIYVGILDKINIVFYLDGDVITQIY